MLATNESHATELFYRAMGRRTPKSETKLVAAVLFYGACGCSARKRGGGVERESNSLRAWFTLLPSRARRMFGVYFPTGDSRPISIHDRSIFANRERKGLDERESRGNLAGKREATIDDHLIDDPIFHNERESSGARHAASRRILLSPLRSTFAFLAQFLERAPRARARARARIRRLIAMLEVRERGNAKRSYISVTLP